MKRFLLLSVLVIFVAQLQAGQETARVVEIVSNTEVKTLGPTGRWQQIQLAGIKPIEKNHPINQSGKKRLQGLVLGKTVQLETLPDNRTIVTYGGLDISARLLEDGLAQIDGHSLQTMPMGKQQQFISAQERARQYRRGYWFEQKKQPVQRFHYPQWPEQGFPAPITNAPVFKP